MYNINGQDYVPLNPNKKVRSIQTVPDALLCPGDTVHLTYRQKNGRWK